mgnify:CR=1 FL=1
MLAASQAPRPASRAHTHVDDAAVHQRLPHFAHTVTGAAQDRPAELLARLCEDTRAEVLCTTARALCGPLLEQLDDEDVRVGESGCVREYVCSCRFADASSWRLA